MRKIITLISFAFCVSTYAQVITTVIGNGVLGYLGDGGLATAAEITAPTTIRCDDLGNLYIVDRDNNRIRIINTSGIISTIAGGGTGAIGDGGQATDARLDYPFDVNFDAIGNMYIADGSNSRIRKVSTSGVITTTVGVGGGVCSGNGGAATAAGLSYPTGIFVDGAENLYITDACNLVRMVNASGTINVIAGGGNSGIGDGGQATLAELSHPYRISFDKAGNMYITDGADDRIRKVNSAGIITTVVGNGTNGYSGDGGLATAAEINDPTEIIFDSTGNLYFSDSGNNVVRKVTPSGIITTIVGNGTSGFNGDGGQANLAELSGPVGLCFDASGNLYVGDTGNNRVRKVTNIANASIGQYNHNNSVHIYPNPAQNNFTIETNVSDKQTLQVFDVNGKLVLTQTINNTTNIDASTLAQGVYNVSLTGNTGVINKRLVIVK